MIYGMAAMADSPLRTFPAELLETILGFLSPPEVAAAQQVCRAWWAAAEDSPRLRAARKVWLAPPTEVLTDGMRIWKNAAGQRHRGDDRPAVIWANVGQVWFVRGDCHRSGDRPAVVRANGDQEWFERGQRHREGDRPATISANGDQEWWERGRRHREGNQPAVVRANGTQEWWVRGVRQPKPPGQLE